MWSIWLCQVIVFRVKAALGKQMLIKLFTMTATRTEPLIQAVRDAKGTDSARTMETWAEGRADTACWLTHGIGHSRVLLTQRLGHTWSKARSDVNWFILKNEQQLITSVGLYCSMQFKAHSAVAELCKFVSLEKPCCLEGLFICGGQAGVSPAWHCFQGTQKLLSLALQEGQRLQQPTW